MSKAKQVYVGLCAVALILAVVSAVTRIVSSSSSREKSPSPPLAVDKPTSTPIIGEIVTEPMLDYGYESTSTLVSEDTKLTEETLMPDIDRPIIIPGYFLPDIAASATEKIHSLTAALKENRQNAALWAALGLRRKSIEDYEGARQALEYAHVLSPRYVTTLDNLGILYGYYLKDAEKSESYFLKALELEPMETFRYLRLFEFYRDISKDAAKARAVLQRGLTLMPENGILESLLLCANCSRM